MPALPSLLALSTTMFMMAVVSSSAAAAALIALDLLSLRHRSTSRMSVAAAALVLLAFMTSVLALGLVSTGRAAPVLSTDVGRIAGALAALGFLASLVGLTQFAFSDRLRRGKRRVRWSAVGALLVIALLAYSDHRTRHPSAPTEIPSTTEPIELDSNLAIERRTPTPRPTPATPAPPPTRSEPGLD